MERKKLLIADDSEMNRAILANMLESDYEIIEVSDGQEALSALQTFRGELAALLLDTVMPEMDGFTVLEEMNHRGWLEDLPVIMISAETGGTTIDHAFDLGASDYISRPFATGLVRRRIINTILLHAKKQQLVDVVAGHFFRQEKNNNVIIAILDYALEIRCGEGGSHMSDVGHITRLLLRRLLQKTDHYRTEAGDADTIALAAGLHDIGKILIPEEILKKPGKLTAEEFEIVKQHTTIGSQLIASLPFYQNETLVKYAIEISRRHHERWNGEGYPDGLRGDDIPIAAQVTALADVYDALTSKRSYKEAFSHEKALQMIHNGECGSFNPLLLECLDEISNTIKRDHNAMGAGQNPNAAHLAAEALYQSHDVAAARMTQQLEDSYSRQNFFTGLSQELWFEYTVQPSSLRLSRGAMEHTGLPAVIVDPLQNIDFLTVVGEETVAKIRKQMATLAVDEMYAETSARLMIDGRLCRCRLALFISWSTEQQCRSLFGKVTDVDENYRRLEELEQGAIQELPGQVLLPIPEVGNVLKITRDQIGPVLQSYRQLFQIVRLVDPEICMQLHTEANDHSIGEVEHCFSVWGKSERCRHCISQDVIRTRHTQNKIETIGSDLYYVLASCVEVDGHPYSLECVNPIHPDDMDEDENILSQLLMRNRQVFTDSVTKVFNRRYYEDRLRRLSGEHALAMIDLDNLKQINDHFGHPAGDAALYRAAQTMRSVLLGKDELVRYGGDEFLLLFHDLPESILQKKLDEICQAVRGIRIPEYPDLRMSVSIGGIYAAGSIPELVQKADLALYRAKRQKNNAVIYQEEPHDLT